MAQSVAVYGIYIYNIEPIQYLWDPATVVSTQEIKLIWRNTFLGPHEHRLNNEFDLPVYAMVVELF